MPYFKLIMSVSLIFLLVFVAEAKQKQGVTSLQDTVSASLRHHKGLKAHQENRDALLHEVDRAKSGWGPKIDINSRSGVSRLSNTTSRAYKADKKFYGDGGGGLTLTQPLWDGWSTRNRVRSAEASLEAMTSRVIDSATTIGLQAISAHIDLARRREIYRLAQENIQRHEKILTTIKERVELGADTQADVTQTQGRLSRAKSTLSESKSSLLQGEDSYCRLTGLPVPVNLEAAKLPEDFYTNAGAVLDDAQKSNPQLLAYLSDIKAAVSERDLAKSAFHPTINFEVSPQYSDHHGPGNQWSSGVDVMGTLRWNLFNSGADRAATEAATSRIRQARQTMFNYLDELKLEIDNAWTEYISSQEQYKYYLEAIKYNAETRDAYLEQFILGRRSLLDVLDAENELFNTRTQAVTAKSSIEVNTYRLYALAGNLLPKLDISSNELRIAPKEALPEPEWSFKRIKKSEKK